MQSLQDLRASIIKGQMCVEELKDYINWAEEEAREYEEFADELRDELRTRQ